jgi:hypothetical protein
VFSAATDARGQTGRRKSGKRMAFEYPSQVLHWRPAEDRREPVSWDDWLQFRELKQPFIPLPGVKGGIHYFVVYIHDDSTPINLVPHKYLIDADGLLCRRSGLTSSPPGRGRRSRMPSAWRGLMSSPALISDGQGERLQQACSSVIAEHVGVAHIRWRQ